RVRVPTIRTLETELRDHLRTFRHVRVVPPGSGKNLENLGDEGASLIVDAIREVQTFKLKTSGEQKVRIALSSGQTLQRTCERLVEKLRENPRILESELGFFPAALFWTPEIKAYYPVSLVSTLFTRLHETFGDRIRAFAPMLPGRYYDDELWQVG